MTSLPLLLLLLASSVCPSPLSSLLSFSFSSLRSSPPFDSSSCGRTKGCFLPRGCVPGDSNKECPMAFSYRSLNSSLVEMELYAPIDQGSDESKFYVAVGFSDDDRMGNESVTECSRLPNEPVFSVKASYNDYHPKKEEDGSTKVKPDNRRIEGEERLRGSIFPSWSGRVVEGSVYCKWTQSISGLPGGEFLESDLSRPFYFLLGKGSTVDGGLASHHKNRAVPELSATLKFNAASSLIVSPLIWSIIAKFL